MWWGSLLNTKASHDEYANASDLFYHIQPTLRDDDVEAAHSSGGTLQASVLRLV
jgi:hypothetical protein